MPGEGDLCLLANEVTGGLIVVLVSDELVRAGRRDHAGQENVMFVPGSAEDIPWRDGFFTQVLDPLGEWEGSEKAQSEIRRVRST